MTSLCRLLIAALLLKVASACNNCLVLSKAEKAMFQSHEAACRAQSGASAAQVAALVAGAAVDAPALRRHVYCVLRRGKLLAKDGKLLKAALGGKLAPRTDSRHGGKWMETCAEQTAQSPEDAAWQVFRCGYSAPSHRTPEALSLSSSHSHSPLASSRV